MSWTLIRDAIFAAHETYTAHSFLVRVRREVETLGEGEALTQGTRSLAREAAQILRDAADAADRIARD